MLRIIQKYCCVINALFYDFTHLYNWRDIGDSSGVELISYLADKGVARLSDAIKAVNHFSATPRIASIDMDGTDYDIEMSELYRAIANKILWDLLKEYK